MIENKPNELTLIYHSDKDQDKKARAFVESAARQIVKTIDLKREKLTETQLAEIATKMGVTVHDLIDPTYKDRFPSNDKNVDASEQDLLTVMREDPIVIHTPIVIIGRKAYSYESAYELLLKNSTTEGVSLNSEDAVKEEKRKF